MSSSNGRKQSPFHLKNNFQNTDLFATYDNKLAASQENSTFESLPTISKNLEFVELQRKLLLGKLSFGITRTCIIGHVSQSYHLTRNTVCALLIHAVLHINAIIKGIFLVFVLMEYFGPVEFLDKIATVDFILCVCLVGIGASILFYPYPFYEMLQSMWKVLNSIYWKHGCPDIMRLRVEQMQRQILKQHLIIVFGGCASLMIQYFPDPKYCNFTYALFETDNLPLRLLFGLHEFCFMLLAWGAYAGPSTLCMYQGVATSSAIDRMNETLKRLFVDEMTVKTVETEDGTKKMVIRKNVIKPGKLVPNTEYDIETILFDYKQLMMISDQFNATIAYKTLLLHLVGGIQFVSDVFAATHVLRIPGTGFTDVWFYLQDCMCAGFLLLRVYHFMGMVSNSAEAFLVSFNEYLTFQNPNRVYLRKVARTLKVVTFHVGPCQIWPESVLAVLDTMGNYYVCAALW